MKTPTLVNGTYYNKYDVLVELETKQRISTGNIQATIDLLNKRKNEAIKMFDDEIKVNEDLLAAVSPVVEAVELSIEPVRELKTK
jgi:hypothetical protein